MRRSSRSYGAWPNAVSGGRWTGTHALTQLRSLTGDPNAVIGADGRHFWPYGLNYPSEVTSPQDLIRHCQLVVALRQDMGL